MAAKHARKRATPAAAARNKAAATAARKPKAKQVRVRYVGGRPMGSPATVPKSSTVTPTQAGQRGYGAATAVTQRKSYSGKHMLTAEFLIAVGIVAIRAVADYEPQADGTMKGKVGHPQGQYGPLPVLAGLIVTFFLLSFLAASGGLKAKLAVIAGGVVDLALLMKSQSELATVGLVFSTFGKAQKPPAGDWQTTGDQAGSPLAGAAPPASSSSGNGSGGGGGGFPVVRPGPPAT